MTVAFLRNRPAIIPAPDRDPRSNRRHFRGRSTTATNLPATLLPGPSIDARCSIKLSTPPRLVARMKIFVFAATFIAASRPPLTSKRKHPTKHRHLSCRDLVARMRLQPGIIHAFDFLMLRQKLCDFHCIFRMRAHSPRQCAHAPQNQPAIERRGDCAAAVLDVADALKKFIVRLCDDNSTEHVAMAAEIFRRGMQN